MQYTSLTSSLGKPAITAAQAKKLVSVGFSHAGLVKLHSEAKDDEDFSQKLKAMGVNSKPLKVKLAKLPELSLQAHKAKLHARNSSFQSNTGNSLEISSREVGVTFSL